MKVTRVRSTALRAAATGNARTSTASFPSRESCLVEVETDEGLTGVGDSQRPESPEALCHVVNDILAPSILGEDPSRIEALWAAMYHRLRIRGRTKGIAVEALSAVDIALWDLAAKSLRVPLCRMMGGGCRGALPVYATEVMYGKKTAERVREAEGFVSRGFRAFKVAVGLDHGSDVEAIRTMRERLGHDVGIAVDANCSLNYKGALRLARSLERFELMWLEEPMPPEFLNEYAALRRQTNVPVAAGESEFTAYGFKDWIARGAVDIVQPDVGRVGGVTQLKRVATMAEAFGLEFAPHCGHGSAVTYAATMHVAASSPNFRILELEQIHNPLREGLLRRRVDLQRGGLLAVPASPGIGAELDDRFVARHRLMELSTP